MPRRSEATATLGGGSLAYFSVVNCVDYRKVPWLARTHAVTTVPSAAALRTLRQLPPGKPGRGELVGFGDPMFDKDRVTRRRAIGPTIFGSMEPQALCCDLFMNGRHGVINCAGEKENAMADDDMKAELERLRRENAALKKGASDGIRMKVSEKGAVSVYGMGRFPVTLYKEQWLKLLNMSDEIREFIAENEARLKAKD